MKWNAVLLLATLLHVVHAETSYICEQGYSGPANSEYCYKLFSTPPSLFADARSLCQKDGGDLASIHNAFEDAFVKTLGNGMLIGLQYSESMNAYQWSDGTTLDYKNYAADFEVNADFLGYCTQHLNGKWDNADCDADLLPFLCKKPALTYTPTPNNVCPNSTIYYTYGGVIFSPGYPNNFAAGLTCFYKLAARNGYIIKLYLEDLKITFLSDDFRLYNHYDNEETLRFIDFYKTETTGYEITLPTNRLSIIFDGQAGGTWKLRWEEVKRSLTKAVAPAPWTKSESYYCDLGYTLSGELCYRLSTDTKLNYYDAVAYCRNEGADLASIHESYTDLYIQSLTKSTETLIGLLYIGNNAYQWSDGTPTDFDDYDSDFVPMREFLGYCAKVHGGKWQNAECDDKLSFVCQKKATNFTATPANACPDSTIVYKTSGVLFSPGYPQKYSGLGVCSYELMTRKNTFIRMVVEEAEFPSGSSFTGYYYSNGQWVQSSYQEWYTTLRGAELIIPHNRYLLKFNPRGTTGYWKFSWAETPIP